MSNYLGHQEYRHGTVGGIGILLMNLGTPDAPNSAALRRYLGEFLADPRVVETPRWLWRLILHGVILRIRPARSARAYRRVWTELGSPLLLYSKQQLHALKQQLPGHFETPLHIELAMRYGNPPVASALQRLYQSNISSLLVLPLYPQYSATTTASAFDAVSEQLKRWRWLPDVRFISHYHDFEPYIEAMAAHIRRYWQAKGRGQCIVFSFHGLPRRYLLRGDPYHCQCLKTARLLATALGLAEEQWRVAFQSRFGREEWLRPYCDDMLRQLSEQGIGHVQVFCPGFAADCLETLEEIAMEHKDIFFNAGGKHFDYIPAVNADSDHIDALVALIRQNTQGWGLKPATQAMLEQTRQRAMSLGASQ